MKIKDISKEVIWSKENGLVFLASKEDFNYLNEYLSNQKLDNIDYEINHLTKFKSMMTKSLSDIENYIINNLEGFNSYGDKIYARISGAHDFTISVLYSLKSNRIFLKHPHFEDEFNIEIDVLISLLEKTRKLFDVIN